MACRDGNECNAQCEVPTGDVIVTGVLYRYRDHFAIDIEQLEHRIGPCKLLETETRPSELSPTDQCDAKLACDDGKTLEVTCDAENDHSYTSLCQCKVAGVAVTLAEPIIGEAPKSCDYAAKECLRAAGEPGRR